jgi:hypothetical protein
MSRTVTISDGLALQLEERRRLTGQGSVDDVAEALIAESLAFDAVEVDAGYTVDELRALIAEAEASGPVELWSPTEVSAEIRRRYAARQTG